MLSGVVKTLPCVTNLSDIMTKLVPLGSGYHELINEPNYCLHAPLLHKFIDMPILFILLSIHDALHRGLTEE